MQQEAESVKSKRSPVVDAHTHIFCWGENPQEGFLSEQTHSSRVTRLLLRVTGITREPGDTLSDKLRNRLLRELDRSGLDFAVVLAQDAVYRPDGSRNDAATHFYVSNDYVLELAKRSSKVLAGCSINPVRSDALEEIPLSTCQTALCFPHWLVAGGAFQPARPGPLHQTDVPIRRKL